MKNKVLDLLEKKHKSSGGHCGIKLVDFGINIKDLKIILNELFKEKKISVHDSPHGKLIKLKKNNLKKS